MKPLKFAFVDVETTGGSPISDRVIDLGIVLVDDFLQTKEWHSLINPECDISPFISTITTITNVDVMDAPIFADVADEVEELLSDRIFVAHNVRFDYSFMKHEFTRLKKKFISPHLCTVKLSRKLYPEFQRHNLDELIERFQLPMTTRHRALPDAKALYSFVQMARTTKGVETVESAIRELCKTPSLPSQIPAAMIDSLPNTVGVYGFYNQEGTPLYIGKSIHIRERVKEHFYEDTESTRALEMNQHTSFIDATVCAGELEALLTESRLVKTLQPLYNKQLRKNQNQWIALISYNQNGYITLEISETDTVTYSDRLQIAAFSRSKRTLLNLINKLSAQYRLCLKLAGIEKGKGACFNYHLGSCDGACITKEPPEEYNKRCLDAFCSYQIQKWPFDTPIAIHEYNEDSEVHSYIIVDRWSVKKVARDDIPEDLTIDEDAVIQPDEYPILVAQIAKARTKIILLKHTVDELSSIR